MVTPYREQSAALMARAARARRPGMAGFAARRGITADLIGQSLEKDRALKREQSQLASRTDLQQTKMQQDAAAARQQLVQAGNLALEELRGRNAAAADTREQSARLTQIDRAAEQERETASFQTELQRDYLDYVLSISEKGKKKTPYNVKVGGEEEEDDLLDLARDASQSVSTLNALF